MVIWRDTQLTVLTAKFFVNFGVSVLGPLKNGVAGKIAGLIAHCRSSSVRGS